MPRMGDTPPDVPRNTPHHDGTHGTHHDSVPVHDAARLLGISENAVRARLRRGSLNGVKHGTSWYVSLHHMDVPTEHHTSQRDTPSDDDKPSDGTHQPRTATPHDVPDDARGVALVELVADLSQRNAELAAAAAMWQTRAAHLEDRLKQLTAGVTPSETVPEPPGSPETNDTGPRGLLDRLLRWWRG